MSWIENGSAFLTEHKQLFKYTKLRFVLAMELISTQSCHRGQTICSRVTAESIKTVLTYINFHFGPKFTCLQTGDRVKLRELLRNIQTVSCYNPDLKAFILTASIQIGLADLPLEETALYLTPIAATLGVKASFSIRQLKGDLK